MPIYNGIQFIEDSINSVKTQTYTNWELLIGINGFNKDSETFNIANKYTDKEGKIKVFDLYTIKGKSNTLNKLLTLCKYDYVAILDVDDIWINNKLEIQSKLLYKYDIIRSKCIYFGEKNNIIPNIPVYDNI